MEKKFDYDSKTKTCCQNCDTARNGIIVNHRAYFKLWISDVHLMMPSPIQEKAYIFRQRTVERVIIFGTITDVKQFNTNVLYEVDDGTGNINCIYNHNYALSDTTKNVMNEYSNYFNVKKEDNDSNNLAAVSRLVEIDEESVAIKNSFEWMLKEVNRFKRKMKNVFDLGDTICVKGKLKEFYGRREIQVYQLHVIDNLKDETNHILELVNLYNNEYSKYL